MRRLPKSYKRRAPSREPYDSVLIVCEGSKSEPNYLRKLCTACNLSTANIRITPSPGTDPMSVVRYAETLSAEAIPKYNKVYCVFDRDGHVKYQEAIAYVKNSSEGRAGRFFTITSWPCFEVWVLLHYTYTTSGFTVGGGRSSCENVIQKIKDYIPDYGKGDPNLHDVISPQTLTAITHGKRLERHNNENGSTNPATQLHSHVEYLHNLKQ